MKNLAEKSVPGKHRLACALLLVTASGIAQAAQPNVRLYGALVAEPCVLLPGSEEIALNFGSVTDKYLYLNQRTPGQAFTLELADCDTSLGKTVSVTFVGTESVVLPGLLAVDTGSDVQGIAIGLEMPDAKPLPINQVSGKLLLQTGSNAIALKAYVQGEPAAIANQSIERGTFSATATFSLAYE